MTRGSNTLGLVLAVALVLCSGIVNPAQAQTIPSGVQFTRNNWALRGNVIAAPGAGDPHTCFVACEGTTACTGYSFDAHANPVCVLLSGVLVDVTVAGAMSCRNPCTGVIVGPPQPAATVVAPVRPPIPPLPRR
jgi:hypothetical protein